MPEKQFEVILNKKQFEFLGLGLVVLTRNKNKLTNKILFPDFISYKDNGGELSEEE